MTGSFFQLVLTSSAASLLSSKIATSFFAPCILYICICMYIGIYIYIYVFVSYILYMLNFILTPCICAGVLLKHMYSQSLEKDFSSEELSLQGEPGFSFSKLSAHLGADFLFPSSLSTSDRGPWPLPGPCHWKFPTWKQQGQHANHQGLCPPGSNHLEDHPKVFFMSLPGFWCIALRSLKRLVIASYSLDTLVLALSTTFHELWLSANGSILMSGPWSPKASFILLT